MHGVSSTRLTSAFRARTSLSLEARTRFPRAVAALGDDRRPSEGPLPSSRKRRGSKSLRTPRWPHRPLATPMRFEYAFLSANRPGDGEGGGRGEPADEGRLDRTAERRNPRESALDQAEDEQGQQRDRHADEQG